MELGLIVHHGADLPADREEVINMVHDTQRVSLPHQGLHVWQLSIELVRLVASIALADLGNRDQARAAASSCARNIAEGAGRQSRRDKARVYAIARGEAVECVAAVEIAGALGACATADVARVVQLGGRVSAMLARLG